MNSYTPIYPEDHQIVEILKKQEKLPADVITSIHEFDLANETNQPIRGMFLRTIKDHFEQLVRKHNLA